MNRKRAIGVLVVLVFLVVGTVSATVAYPLTYDNHENNFDTEPPDEPYSEEGEILVNGKRMLEYESAVASDSESAWVSYRLHDADRPDHGVDEYELYWDGEYVHDRVQSDDQEVLDRYVERETAVNATIDHARGEALVVDEAPDPTLQNSREDLHRVIVGDLEQTTYDHVETRTIEGEEVDVYEPENGWFEAGLSYRITNASGVVHVDATTGEVRYAEVTFDKTRADTYVDYLYNRDDTATLSIRYVRLDPRTEVDEPDWTIRAE